ncbi:MAG: PEGA domain-containing protein [Deferribacteres bacterium]|nr:PEGA domain-containing protein [Deferribacteres bacterium]
MKMKYLAILNLILLPFPLHSQTMPQLPKVALLNFQMRGEMSDFETDMLVEKLRQEIIHAASWHVLNKNEMTTILGDSLPNAIRAANLKEAQKIGNALDAALLVYGVIARQDSLCGWRLLVYDTRSKRNRTSLTKRFTLQDTVANAVLQDITAQLDIGPNSCVTANDSTGVLKIVSEPDSCLVTLGNEFIGYTPLQLGFLPEKTYELQFTKAHYKSSRGVVTVKKAKTQEVRMLLRKEVRIFVQSEPSGAMIYVNDAPIGLSPQTIRATANLPYNFRFSHPDFDDVQKQLTFSDDKTLTVQFPNKTKRWIYIGGGVAATMGTLYYLVYHGTGSEEERIAGLPAPPGRP